MTCPYNTLCPWYAVGFSQRPLLGRFMNRLDNTLTVTVCHLAVSQNRASLSFKKLPLLRPLVFQRNKHRYPLTNLHRSEETRRLKWIVLFPQSPGGKRLPAGG